APSLEDNFRNPLPGIDSSRHHAIPAPGHENLREDARRTELPSPPAEDPGSTSIADASARVNRPIEARIAWPSIRTFDSRREPEDDGRCDRRPDGVEPLAISDRNWLDDALCRSDIPLILHH